MQGSPLAAIRSIGENDPLAYEAMKKKILVVDDTNFYLNLMTRILAPGGHEVVTAQDGFQALGALASFDPDIIFVDLIMPKIKGDQLCRLIRKMPHLRNCYIVVVSAAVDDKAFDFRKIGADACIAKTSPKELSAAMAEAVKAAHARTVSPDPRSKDRAAAAPQTIASSREKTSPDYHDRVLEHIPEGILQLDGETVIYANRRILSLLDRTLEEVRGQTVQRIFPDTVHVRFDSPPANADGFPSKNLKDAISINGRHLVVHSVEDPADPTRRTVILNDVSRLKEIEGALNESIVYSESIIDCVADSLIVLDPDLRINRVNRATCELLGYTEHELFNMSMDEIMEVEGGFHERIVRKLRQNGEVGLPNGFYRTKSGASIPVSFMGTLLDVSGGGIICTAHDLRELLELQNQVIQSEKMATTGVLAAGVAHEIKNPLAIILQGVEALEFSLASGGKRRIMADMIRRIRSAADRADAIVKGLLDYSKQSPAASAAHRLETIVDEALSLVENQTTIQSIRIERRYSAATPPIRADKIQIQQVIINLLVNAMDAMPKGGTITIRTRAVEVNGDNRFAQLLFSDTGSGIAPEHMQRIFEPFFSTKSDSMSVGLGLAISRGIIDKHGGTINIHSEPNKGTHVTIDLPAFG